MNTENVFTEFVKTGEEIYLYRKNNETAYKLRIKLLK